MHTAAPQIVDLTLVPVHVGLGKAGPWVKPESCTAWTRPGAADLVHFQGPDAFTIEFENDSPFRDRKYVAQQSPPNGPFVVEERIRPNAPDGSYKYVLTIDGRRLDPDIVVRGDPR